MERQALPTQWTTGVATTKGYDTTSETVHDIPTSPEKPYTSLIDSDPKGRWTTKHVRCQPKLTGTELANLKGPADPTMTPAQTLARVQTHPTISTPNELQFGRHHGKCKGWAHHIGLHSMRQLWLTHSHLDPRRTRRHYHYISKRRTC